MRPTDEATRLRESRHSIEQQDPTTVLPTGPLLPARVFCASVPPGRKDRIMLVYTYLEEHQPLYTRKDIMTVFAPDVF